MEAAPPRLRVLFVSPYPICPPVHGGGVFMYQTLRELARLAEVHVVELLDYAWQTCGERGAAALLRVGGVAGAAGRRSPGGPAQCSRTRCASSPTGDLEWLIHRQIYLKHIDVLQLEYTPMAQYRGEFRRIACALFEHDVYFQSIARGLGHFPGLLGELKARLEYLRALRYEMRTLPAFDQVQVCTPANRDYLLSFLPGLAGRTKAGLRAGIDTSRYEFRECGREPLTMLFLGSFRHDPNRVAMDWFVGEVHAADAGPDARGAAGDGGIGSAAGARLGRSFGGAGMLGCR